MAIQNIAPNIYTPNSLIINLSHPMWILYYAYIMHITPIYNQNLLI